ncbi:MAG TPA: hypothetical protein PK398_00220 [Candidatus Gracilibacteria bacterium]|nr:hypothetical protein [Candidatus Gracilibacteria bacterium]
MFKKFNSFSENRFIFETPGEAPKWHPPMAMPEEIQNPTDALQEIHDSRRDLSVGVLGSVASEVEKGEEAVKTMRLLGISQKKFDEVMNDETNPYSAWVVDFLGRFSSQNLVLKSRPGKDNPNYLFKHKGRDIAFPISNLDRAFMWKGKIFPQISKIIGANNYEKYASAIWDAVEQDAPRMAEFLDWVCDGRVSNPSFVLNMNSLVKAELDKLLNGMTVAQLKAEDARVKREVSVERSNDLVKLFRTLDIDPDRWGNRDDIRAKIDAKTALYDKREAERQEKYRDIIAEQRALFRERVGAGPLSDEDYAYANESLDGLIDDVMDRVDNDEISALNNQVKNAMAEAQEMARNGSSSSDIKAYFDSLGLQDSYKALSASEETAADISMLSDLYQSQVETMFDHYGWSLTEPAGEGIDKTDSLSNSPSSEKGGQE